MPQLSQSARVAVMRAQASPAAISGTVTGYSPQTTAASRPVLDQPSPHPARRHDRRSTS
jgi:hypothetical protein